jgi:hypothetical protein
MLGLPNRGERLLFEALSRGCSKTIVDLVCRAGAREDLGVRRCAHELAELRPKR